MADNYLEKKMEEHRLGRSSSYKPKLTPRGTRPGEWLVKFTPCPVVISDISAPLMPEIVKELVAAGFKTYITGEDNLRDIRLASTLGAKFLPSGFPVDPSAMTIRQTESRIDVSVKGQGFHVQIPATSVDTEPKDLSPQLIDDTIKSIVWSAIMLANLNGISENMLRNIKIEGFSL